MAESQNNPEAALQGLLEAFEDKSTIINMGPPVPETPDQVRIRQSLCEAVNSDPCPRDILEQCHGQDNVWDTQELQEVFIVHHFMAPFCSVTRKADGVKGTLEFQHRPRFYYGFRAD